MSSELSQSSKDRGLPVQIIGDFSLLGEVQDATHSQHCLPGTLQPAVAGLDSAVGAHQAHGSMQAQGTASSGAQWWTSSNQPFSQPAAAPCWTSEWKLLRQFPAVMPGPSSTPLPRSVRERCGASLQRLTCRTLSLHPPGSLIKRLAAASLPGPAKSNHIAEAQREMLSGTEVRG